MLSESSPSTVGPANIIDTQAASASIAPHRRRAANGAASPGELVRFAVGTCSLDVLLVALTRRGICAILLGDDAQTLSGDLRRRFPRARIVAAGDALQESLAAVVACIEAPYLRMQLPLDLAGTAFQQRVWAALQEIAPGATASYAQIAAAIGAPASGRAVAGACAANPLAVIVPCHRVVCTDGALSGYRWGIERKRRLLEREAST